MIANTKQIRKLIRKHYSNIILSGSYTDKASDPDMRLVSFKVSTNNLGNLEKDVKVLMFLAGYENRVSVTESMSDYFSRSTGGQYLRIKASFVA